MMIMLCYRSRTASCVGGPIRPMNIGNDDFVSIPNQTSNLLFQL